MRKAVFFLTFIMAAVTMLAQQSTPSPAAKGHGQAPAKKAGTAASADAPSREEVLKLFDLLQISKTMDVAIRAAKQQSREMAEQMIEERAPEATREQKKQFEAMIDEVMNQALGPAAIKQMLDATIPVYQHHLTRTDLKAMVDFYSSPVGQKILREQPAMVQESMQAASGIQQRIARTVFQKIDQRMQEIMRSEEQKQP
ncbi:MAG TPA: DUF2059 domain-containing protein [Candidatus Sulfotelmatobacter sp.]|nr:DUF2059 domain-containing protein [Candidatus Sulfotelmatobacter sp.]